MSFRHSPDPNNPRLSAEAELLEKGVGAWGGCLSHIYIYIYIENVYTYIYIHIHI